MTTEVRIEMLDINHPAIVEVKINHRGDVIWINIDGICRLRACGVKTLLIEDERDEDGL
jgi:predicted transcriptional regulator